MKRWLALAVLALVLAGGWLWLSPQVTLAQIKRAADAGDVTALSAHVDYPALRESVKQELRDKIDPNAGGLAAIAGAIVDRVGDPLIDAAVTPQGLRLIFASASAMPQRAAVAEPPLGLRADRMAIRREALGRFVLVDRTRPGTALVFAYRGLGWKLVGVRLD